jgi:quinol monooxygenase YgiN
MIGYYTTFTTRLEDREKLVALLLQAAKSMSVVEDCKLYEVALDATNPAVTSVTELWTDEQAHDASLQNDKTKALIAEAIPLLTDQPKQAKLGPVITSWV